MTSDPGSSVDSEPAADSTDDGSPRQVPDTPDTSLTVFLVRHGETPQHAQNRYVGRTDAPLAVEGKQQAEQLAVWAGQARLTAIMSSPLIRARETAEPSGRACGLQVEVDERWRELDFGRAEELTAAQMRSRFPAARAAFEVDPVAHPLPAGEDPLDALERGRAVLEETVRAHQGGRVLVVAHGTLLRIVLCDLLGIPAQRYRHVFPAMRNVSGAVLSYRPKRAAPGLLAYNPVLGPESDW